MIPLLQSRLRLRGSDEGIAMVMVLGVTAVMTILLVSALALSLGNSKSSSKDESWSAALAAAYAGIAEYQSRISDQPAYVKYGNPDSNYSNPTHVTPSTVSLPTIVNPAFGVGVNGAWASLPGSTSGARYRYEVDNSDYANTGTIRIRSTGLVNGQARSIIADLRQTGFIDFLYFTDYEMSDPSISNGNCSVVHTWEGRGGCTIQFAATDTIGGPVHSNDTLQICGAHFKGTVTTGDPAGGYNKPSGCSNGVFDIANPIYSPSIPMPATNTQLKKETRTDLTTTDVPLPGCLYTGPTQITYISGGKMTVKSPWTKFTNVQGDPATAGDNSQSAKCGTVADLHSAAGATIPVPNNGVVYVQNIPLTGINSATSAETTTTGSNARCRDLDGSTIASTQSYARNILGFPANDGSNTVATMEKPLTPGTDSTASYGCRNGDLFVRGTLSGGSMTAAAENYVYVTGDITYNNADTDMLGLIGQNAVWVYNPMTAASTPAPITSYTAQNREIDAAILSVAHTFTVQNYDKGTSRGTLTVKGAISQKFRGPVATTGGTGYAKNYVYDARYRYTAPPKFLSPVTTTYGVTVWAETKAAFQASGAY